MCIDVHVDAGHTRLGVQRVPIKQLVAVSTDSCCPEAVSDLVAKTSRP